MKKLKEGPQVAENPEIVNAEDGLKPVDTGELAKEAMAVNPELNKEAKEDPFAKGRERLSSIGNFFTNTRKNVSSWFSKAGKAISGFSSRAVSFGGEAVAATLSADVLAKKGYNAAAEKAGEKFDQVNEWADKKAEQADEWVYNKFDQFDNWTDKKGEQISDWTSKKGEQISNFATEKIQLTKDAAFYAKDKTVEGLTSVKNGAVKRYNSLMSWGEKALLAAQMEAKKIRDAHRQKMNELRLARLQAEYDRTARKEAAAMEKADKLRLQREALDEKMGLMMNVEEAV